MGRGGGGVGALWPQIVSHTCRGHVTSAARDCEQLNIAWNMIGDSGFIELADALHARDLDAALAFLEFLRERRHVPRERGRGEGGPRDGALVGDADRDEDLDDDHDDAQRVATDGPLQAD